MKKNMFNIFILIFLSIVFFGCKTEKYTISFNANGGSTVDSITQDYKTNVTKPVDPTKDGYIFGGWYKDSALTEAYVFSTMPSKNITLYADWGTDNVEYALSDNSAIIKSCISDSSEVILLRKVSIGGNIVDVKYIGEKAFYNCSNITSIIIPNSVISIGEFAFFCCTSLTSIIIPSSVMNIGYYAFKNCSSLTSITIPKSVININDTAFSGCSSLTIYCESSSKPIGWFSGWDSNRPVYWEINSSNLKEIDSMQYVLKDGYAIMTRYIGNQSEVLIPSTVSIDGKTVDVTQIGDSAFSGWRNLISITIPSSVTSIGDSSFKNCTSLTSITIPNSITSIGDNAFSYCSDLIIYCEVSSKPSGWYANWNSSRPVYWEINSSNFKEIDDIQYVLKDGSAIITKYLGNHSEVLIPSIVSIDGKTVDVTQIGESAFSGCRSLTSITIPSSVTSIGDYAFSSCSSLISITIPSSITSIGDYAFFSCSSLISITIPSSVTRIGNLPFAHCDKLIIYCEVPSQPSGWYSNWNYQIPVYWEINSSNFKEIDGIQYVLIDANAIITRYIGNQSEVLIPSTVSINDKTVDVTQIGQSAFANSSSLTKITIPKSVTSIGESAFYNCNSLTIYCEVITEPPSWNTDWNPQDRPVVWGYAIQ